MSDEAPAQGAAEQTRRGPRIGLLPRILIAIVLGVLLGLVMPEWLARVFMTFNGLFSAFLGFLVPLIIVGLVTPAIGELGRGAGRWLWITTGVAYFSTLIAGFLALAVSWALLPGLLAGASTGSLGNPEDSALAPFFTLEIPPLLPVMTALVLAFCVGIGLTLIPAGTLHDGFAQFRTIIVRTIEAVIIPLLPVYIFGMFLGLTMNGQIWVVIVTFARVILMVFALTIIVLLLQYLVAGAVARRNPFRMLWTMLPAYATALGTSSSAATIPVTLACAKRNGVPDAIASFVVPLCATIHLAGSTLKITSFAIAVMIITGMPLDALQLIGFVCMLGVTMIAAPGVPGGAIVAATGILSSMLGFGEVETGLMIASYVAIDSFGTATNVTGDGAIASIIARFAGGKLGGAREQEPRDAVAAEPQPAAGREAEGQAAQPRAHEGPVAAE